MTPDENQQRRRYWRVVIALLVVHVVFAIALPVSGDEAEYWDCSRHLEWSYLDHTPLLFWLIAGFRKIFGETALAIRAPSLLASVAIAALLPLLYRRLGRGHGEALIAYVVLNATPLFFFNSFYGWTDSLLIAAHVGCVVAAVAIADGDSRGWIGFGVASGLGALAKIPIVFVLPVIIPALFTVEGRRTLRRPAPYVGALVGAALTLPFWLWGAAHSWANLLFQIGSRHKASGFQPRFITDFLLSNILLVTPFLVWPLFVAVARALRSRDAKLLVVAIGALSPVVFFTLVAIRERAGAHWTAPGVVTAFLLLPLFASKLRRWTIAAASMTAILCVAILVIASKPEMFIDLGLNWRRSPKRSTSYLVYAIGNREIAEEALRRLEPGEMVASENYTNVHLFAFLTDGRLATRLAWIKKGGLAGLPSLYWYEPHELRGKNFLFLTNKRSVDEPLRAIFAEVREEPPIEIRRDGRVLRTMRVLRCRNLLRPEGTFTMLYDSGGARAIGEE